MSSGLQLLWVLFGFAIALWWFTGPRGLIVPYERQPSRRLTPGDLDWARGNAVTVGLLMVSAFIWPLLLLAPRAAESVARRLGAKGTRAPHLFEPFSRTKVVASWVVLGCLSIAALGGSLLEGDPFLLLAAAWVDVMFLAAIGHARRRSLVILEPRTG